MVITTFSGTVWTQLTVLILDYVVPWVSHFSRRQGTKDDQRDVFEVENRAGIRRYDPGLEGGMERDKLLYQF